MATNRKNITAIIEIGSNAIYFKIVQAKKKKLEILENLKREIEIGRDSFSSGTIAFEKVIRISEIIQNYQLLANDYGVKEIRAIATTAIREAKNRDYIIDQIKIKTGIKIRWFDDSEEKLNIYKEMVRRINLVPEFNNNEGLLTYIGTGSVGVALYKDGRIIYNQDILIGSLKLDEILGEMKNKTDKYYLLIDEYLSSFTHMLRKILPKKDITFFFVSGREIGLISKFCDATKYDHYQEISIENFNNFYDIIKTKTPEQIIEHYNISDYKAEILLPSMSIYNSIYHLTSSKSILSPKATLIDSLINEDLFPDEHEEILEIINQSSVEVARNMAQRYLYDEKHATKVEEFSLEIFDKLKKIHGLGVRERLLLQIASILHDIGKYINIRNHYHHSYNIIMASDIIGINETEKSIIANIARYHSKQLPTKKHRSFTILKKKEQVLMSKLVAILRLADALDRSHKQKIEDLKIKFKFDTLTFQVKAGYNINLDELTFNEKSKFFKEVFGITTLIKRKR